MEPKFIILGVAGIIAFNLVVFFIIQKTTEDKDLKNYLKNNDSGAKKYRAE